MSVLHECPDCGTAWETAWGEDAGECPHCERVQERLARGGRGLTARERAATADFCGAVVPPEGLPYSVQGREGALTWGDDGFTDHATLDGERAAPVPVEVRG